MLLRNNKTQANGLVLPDISNDTQYHQMKYSMNLLKDELKESEMKCQALKRNFESLSALLTKTEAEK